MDPCQNSAGVLRRADRGGIPAMGAGVVPKLLNHRAFRGVDRGSKWSAWSWILASLVLVTGPATLADEPRPALADEPRPAMADEPRPAMADEPRPAMADEPRPAMADEPRPAIGAAERLRESITNPALRALVGEVLDRNPAVARARQHAAAVAARAPQVRALPDPYVSLALFALPIETRVGPQRLAAEVSQRIPWFGKLALREQAALFAGAAAEAEVEALRLRLLTEARRSFHELSFLDQHAAIASQEREHLLRHEEIARARYSAGLGLLQEVIKIQADITRSESQLVEIETRRQSVLSSLNALRDRPAVTEAEGAELPSPHAMIPSLEELRRQASRLRPELAASSAELARHEALVKLAGKDSRPDVEVGLGYSVIDRRRDEPGRANPPPDNGDDVLKLTVGAHLPIWRRKLDAVLEEALREQSAAVEHRRQIESEIERDVGDTAARLPLLFRQWRLLEQVLLTQAEEAAKSSEAGYTIGKLNALDLLHADHVLFEVRTAAIRTRADYAVALAELEGATGGSLSDASKIREGASDDR